jgi:hypothetical protein
MQSFWTLKLKCDCRICKKQRKRRGNKEDGRWKMEERENINTRNVVLGESVMMEEREIKRK